MATLRSLAGYAIIASAFALSAFSYWQADVVAQSLNHVTRAEAARIHTSSKSRYLEVGWPHATAFVPKKREAAPKPAPTRSIAVPTSLRGRFLIVGWGVRSKASAHQRVVAASGSTPMPSVRNLVVAWSPTPDRTLALATPSPAPSASFIPGLSDPVAYLPVDAPPEIEVVWISKSAVHIGEIVSGRVQVSSNVAAVEVRIGGYSKSMTKLGPGFFVIEYKVPWLPPFLKHKYRMEVIARNSAGSEAIKYAPIVVI